MFEKYNDMNIDDLNKNKLDLENKLDELKIAEKKSEKIIKKNLAWWFLLPIFGLFIYNSIYVKRKQNSQEGQNLLKIKSEMAMLELEIKIIENKIEIQNSNQKEE
ncbi:hypothetical protein SGLAD_v1c04970 [Spiroplasma gladiatoris]|uniref:Uncharacterized protein n=1 Tax=Spiroplasma gladiatoris TaxID=2143 RepID=A0A4P7AJ64_9MOLU|nr:hypothetical protein [Spiroplasma gladiatoris]QBQ07696.1 hypothetical protein SGLAD_v1c04970 [Spiroplasma gladiatoris]